MCVSVFSFASHWHCHTVHCSITFFSLYPLHLNQCELLLFAECSKYTIWICVRHETNYWSLKNLNTLKNVQFKYSFQNCVRKLVFKLVLFLYEPLNSCRSKLISWRLESKAFKSENIATTNFFEEMHEPSIWHAFRLKEFLMDAQQCQMLNATMTAALSSLFKNKNHHNNNAKRMFDYSVILVEFLPIIEAINASFSGVPLPWVLWDEIIVAKLKLTVVEPYVVNDYPNFMFRLIHTRNDSHSHVVSPGGFHWHVCVYHSNMHAAYCTLFFWFAVEIHFNSIWNGVEWWLKTQQVMKWKFQIKWKAENADYLLVKRRRKNK